MSAWATGYFDNDDAADFLREIGVAGTWATARHALQAAVDADYLEAPEAGAAVAAVGVLAAVMTGAPVLLPDASSVLPAILGPAPPELPALALKALSKVVNGSELDELFSESGGERYDEWLNGISALRNLIVGLA
ncbi:MAG: hypothetical protein JWP35_4158 [Caulobacter sp.]|nr:hypothetical protein [Caulobacter sp.]